MLGGIGVFYMLEFPLRVALVLLGRVGRWRVRSALHAGCAGPKWRRSLSSGLGPTAHAADRYAEWGVSESFRLVPGGAGRGLSASLMPSYGVDPGGSERLWALPDADPLAPNTDAAPSGRLDAELGYSIALSGGFTGTPNVGLGLTDTAREWRVGWRLIPAGTGPGPSLHLNATRREAALDDAETEHGVMLRGAMRW